jgi:hypothetical protein
MKQRYGTSGAWAEWLLKEKGVETTAEKVKRCLTKAGRKGKDSRSFTGEILRGVLFTEKDIRMAFRDLLKRKEK